VLFVVSEDENMATIARIKRVHGASYQAKIKRRSRVLKTKTIRTKAAAREWARKAEADVDLENSRAMAPDSGSLSGNSQFTRWPLGEVAITTG